MTDLPEPEWLKQDRRYFRRKKNAEHMLRRYVRGELSADAARMTEPTDMVERLQASADLAADAHPLEFPPEGHVAVTLVTRLPDGARMRQFFLMDPEDYERRHDLDLALLGAGTRERVGI